MFSLSVELYLGAYRMDEETRSPTDPTAWACPARGAGGGGEGITRHRLSCLVRYPPVRSPRGGSRYSAMIIHNSETNAPSVMTSAATPSA